MNPMFMTMSSMEIIMNEAATRTESNPSISLPLLIGLSRSTYGSSSSSANNAGNDKSTNGDNANTSSRDDEKHINKDDEQQNHQSSSNKDNNDNEEEQLLKMDPSTPFPIKLHTLLSTPNKYSSILSWMVHGRSFKIHDATVFVTQVLSQYFNGSEGDDGGDNCDDEGGDEVVGEGEGGTKKQGAINTAGNASSNIKKNTIDDLQSFENELYKWGFKLYKGPSSSSTSTSKSNKKKSKSATGKMKALDVGSYYHEDFLRGQFDLLDNMVYNNGDKVGDNRRSH